MSIEMKVEIDLLRAEVERLKNELEARSRISVDLVFHEQTTRALRAELRTLHDDLHDSEARVAELEGALREINEASEEAVSTVEDWGMIGDWAELGRIELQKKIDRVAELEAALENERAAEREACAKVAETLYNGTAFNQQIAAAIRARKP